MAEQTDATKEERPNPNEKLAKVFDSEQESEAMVVKGLLDSEGIENDLASATLLQDAFPGMGGMIMGLLDYSAELDYFDRSVMPLLKEAGLRV